MVSSITGPGSEYSPRQGAERQSPARAERNAVPVGVQETASTSVRTPEDAINLLRTRLEQKMEQALGDSAPGAPRTASRGFEPPSAADVASRVLGFVQSRLQQEAEAGAGSDRLANLLEQARAGIEQGFSEAREQLEALGMMNGKLSSEIDDSFGRIQQGLDDLVNRFSGEAPAAQGVESASAVQVEAASREQLAFEVRTRDGDVVTVRMDERRYAGVSTASVSNQQGSASQSSAVSLFAGRYEFSVEGELDAGEREALTALFEDVQNVAGQFFEGDVQAAFQSARKLNLGGNELASFSLNLSSVRSVSASTYESVSERPSTASQLRPLAGLARDIQALGRESMDNGLDAQMLGSLMDRIMSDAQSRSSVNLETGNEDLMNNFWKAIIGSLDQAGGGDSES
ncbi:DUF5610 domain-containing protein [Marinobacter fonticola]|uniref:DUF5610 domain-containing protein n=1 Tax=Marinobacter fonticola TaxID=2603215 RepID=UPI0011E6E871|nr:DUF5610 domain-containing protein [Marinobacter fonticola]